MKKSPLLFIAFLFLSLTACRNTPEKSWIAQALEVSSSQLKLAADKTVSTSALFPGCLWYAYEITGDEELKAQAIRYTNRLNPEQNVKNIRDLGGVICSYANALRLAPSDTIEMVLVKAADTVCMQLSPKNDCICCSNILNSLFSTSKLTGNKKYYDTAVKYAQTTMKHRCRPDNKCQPDNNDSSETRKQAWAVYNYTGCYRETQDIAFLQDAMRMADTIMKQVKTADCISDENDKDANSKESPRDLTTASITASALLELSTLAPDGLRYFSYAETILKSLSQPDYLTSLPHNSDKEVSLNESDYYYLEALKRYLDMLK